MRAPIRQAFTLLELIIAMALLMAIVGPLSYLFLTGTLTTSAGHSMAMLSCLTAQERLEHDLEQLAFPDQADEDAAGTRPPAYRIGEPGPDEGSRISFWIPRARSPGEGLKRRLDLVPVTYFLEPIEGTPGGLLMRREGAGPAVSVAGTVLRRLWFIRMQPSPSTSGAVTRPEDLVPGSEMALPTDLMRVTLTAVARAASEQALDRADARQVHEFTSSFLASLQEPSLPYRIREPGAGDHYQFLVTQGALP